MGYFSNGTESDTYEEHYCNRCENNDKEKGCWILNEHMMYNYDECNNKDSYLHKLIPRSEDGLRNEQCVMFRYKQPQSQCPQCGTWQDDYDGVGVVYCENCLYCSHPSWTGDQCDVCGCTESMKNAVNSFKKWIEQVAKQVGRKILFDFTRAVKNQDRETRVFNEFNEACKFKGEQNGEAESGNES